MGPLVEARNGTLEQRHVLPAVGVEVAHHQLGTVDRHHGVARPPLLDVAEVLAVTEGDLDATG